MIKKVLLVITLLFIINKVAFATLLNNSINLDYSNTLIDTYVYTINPNSDFSSSPTLYEIMQPTNGKISRIYMKWTISKLLPDNASPQVVNITSAILSLSKVGTVSCNLAYMSIHGVNNQTWSGITWNNQVCGSTTGIIDETYGCNATEDSNSTISGNTWSFNITNMLSKQLNNNNENFSLVIIVPNELNPPTACGEMLVSSEPYNVTDCKPLIDAQTMQININYTVLPAVYIYSLNINPNYQIIRTPANPINISWYQYTNSSILTSQLNITKPNGVNDTYNIPTSIGYQSLIYNQTNYSLIGNYIATVYIEDSLSNYSISNINFTMNLFHKSITLNNSQLSDVVSVSYDSPDTNYVTNTMLYTGWYYMTGEKYWSFFKYNLSAGPTIYNLINATLILHPFEWAYITDGISDGARVFEVDNDSWNESTITWNNKPTEINNTYESSRNFYAYCIRDSDTNQRWSVLNMLNNSNNGDKQLSIMLNTSSWQYGVNRLYLIHRRRPYQVIYYQHLITAYHSDYYNTNPSVLNLQSSLTNNFKSGQTTTLSYTQDDNFQIEYSEINITKPDSVNDTHELSNTSGSVNYAFSNTSISGIYNATAFVRDTTGETNITGLTFYVYNVPIISNELLVNLSMSNDETNLLNFTCTDWGNYPSACWAKITREDGSTINETGQVYGTNCSIPITTVNQTGDFYIQGYCNDTVNQVANGTNFHGSRVDPVWNELQYPMTIFEGQTKNLTYFSYLTLNNTLSTTYWNKTVTYNFTKIANITSRDSVTYSFTNETEGVVPSYVTVDYVGESYEAIGHVNITSAKGHHNTLELFDNNSNINNYTIATIDFNYAIGGASIYPVQIENGTITLEFNINSSNGLLLSSSIISILSFNKLFD